MQRISCISFPIDCLKVLFKKKKKRERGKWWMALTVKCCATSFTFKRFDFFYLPKWLYKSICFHMITGIYNLFPSVSLIFKHFGIHCCNTKSLIEIQSNLKHIWNKSYYVIYVICHIFINASLLNLLAKFHRKFISAISNGLIISRNCQDKYFFPLRGLQYL